MSQKRKWKLLAPMVLVMLTAFVSCNPSCNPDTSISADCTVPGLIAAINTANNDSAHNTINLAPGCIYTLTTVESTIDDYGETGLPRITTHMTINGHGAIIQRSPNATTPEFRIFFVTSNTTLTLMDVAVVGGIATNANAHPYGSSGGGIFNLGSLRLRNAQVIMSQAGEVGGGVYCLNGEVEVRENSVLSNNHAGTNGGAIATTDCPLTILDSQISQNTAGFNGGGINSLHGAVPVMLDGAIIDGNSAATAGGGMFTYEAVVTINNSTFSNNNASFGGGYTLGNGSAVIGGNSVFTNNTADNTGGAISASRHGTLRIEFSRIEFNTAVNGGGGIATAASSSILEEVTIEGNSANVGAGVSIADTTFIIFNSDFVLNNGVTAGGLSISNAVGIIHGSTFVENVGSGIRVTDNPGLIRITDCTIRDNEAEGRGAGIQNIAGNIKVDGCTISGNSLIGSNLYGVGVYNGGDMEITNSTVSGNGPAGGGGGIYTKNYLLMLNSTVSGNQDHAGGGIYVGGGTADISFSTITANSSALIGGGIYVLGGSEGGSLDIKNSIVAQNSGADCTGNLNAIGDNMDGDGSCDFNITDNPALGPLANNGGPTETHALQPGSLAIDVVTDCSDVNGVGVSLDQRGATRPTGSLCDIGAYEVTLIPPPLPEEPPLITTITTVPCLQGPGREYPTNMTMDAFQLVNLVGAGFVPGWLVIEVDGVRCWVPDDKLEGWTLELLEAYPIIQIPIESPAPTKKMGSQEKWGQSEAPLV